MADIWSTGKYKPALEIILCALSASKATWVITGSLGMALQGVQVPVHDIDIQTTASGAYALEHYLKEWMLIPVYHRRSDQFRSHFGSGQAAGVDFEIMGDMRIKLADGSWRERVDLKKHRRLVISQRWQVPVLSIDYEIEAYTAMGRMEKVTVLKDWLSKA
jgi:hypothetical protein